MRSLLILTICLLAAGCAKHAVDAPDIDMMIEAEDSVRVAVWNPEQLIADTVPHSQFYDSVLKYVKASVPVEIQKREAAKDLINMGPLLPENLASAAARSNSRKAFASFLERIAAANSELDIDLASLQSYLRRDLDSAMHRDSSKISAALQSLTRREILQPSWRPTFDSMENRLVNTSLSVLDLVDTNASAIVFDTVLRFREPNLAHQFDSLRSIISLTAEAESRIVREASERDKNAAGSQPQPTQAPKDTNLARPF